MPDLPSLAITYTLSFIVALLSRNFSYGVVITLLAHVVWIHVFGIGTYGSPEFYQHWFWVAFLGGMIGHLESLAYNWHPLLDTNYLLYLGVVRTAKKGPRAWSRFGIIIGKCIAAILMIIVSFIPLELQIGPPDWPVYAGLIVTCGALAIAFVVTWAMFRVDQADGKHKGMDIFHVAVQADTNGAGKGLRLGNELNSFILYTAVTIGAFVIGYGLWWVIEDNTVWKTDFWYFYAALIIGGGVGLIMVLIGFILSWRAKRKGYTYQLVTPESPEENSPETTPAAAADGGFPTPAITGTYQSPFKVGSTA